MIKKKFKKGQKVKIINTDSTGIGDITSKEIIGRTVTISEVSTFMSMPYYIESLDFYLMEKNLETV